MDELYPDFLSNATAYARAQTHWSQIWDGIDPFQRQHAGWIAPWLKTTFVDGTEMLDGNPIFTAFSPSLGKAVRVIQREASDDVEDLVFWISDFGGSTFEHNHIFELVVNCRLTFASSVLAKGLLNAWVTGAIDTASLSGCAVANEHEASSFAVASMPFAAA